VTKIFSGLQISINFKHPELVFSNTEKSIELDIFLPSLNMAFEYQGQHHYRFHFLFGSPQMARQLERDEEKRRLCKGKGISLIEVPYWWDGQLSSLCATIRKCRPEIPQIAGYEGDAIPATPPTELVTTSIDFEDQKLLLQTVEFSDAEQFRLPLH